MVEKILYGMRKMSLFDKKLMSYFAIHLSMGTKTFFYIDALIHYDFFNGLIRYDFYSTISCPFMIVFFTIFSYHGLLLGIFGYTPEFFN